MDIIVSYGDKFAVTVRAIYPEVMRESLTAAFKVISAWAKRNYLKMEPSKCHVTLFTPWMAQVDVHPPVFINGQLFPVKKTPKFLGVTFSASISFGPHTEDVITRVARRVSILTALAGTSWGFIKKPCC